MLSVIYLILTALIFAHFVKLFALIVGGIYLPSAMVIVWVCSLIVFVFVLRAATLRFLMNGSVVANLLPWVLYLVIPGVLGIAKNYSAAYLVASIFNMSLVGLAVVSTINIATTSRASIWQSGVATSLQKYFKIVGVIVLAAGGLELAFYMIDDHSYALWVGQLVDKGFLSIAPFWKVADVSIPRIFGFYQNPLTFGYISLLMAGFFWAARERVFLLLAVCGILMAVTKALFVVSMVMGLVLYLARAPKMHVVVGAQILLIAVFGGAVFYIAGAVEAIDVNREAYQSVLTRIETWKILFDLILEEPALLPVGFGITQVAEGNPLGINDVDFAIDNLYLLITLYSGLAGLIAFFIMYYHNLRMLILRVSESAGNERRFRLVVFAVWFLFPIWGVANALIGNYVVFYSTYAVVLAVIWGGANREQQITAGHVVAH